MSQSKLTPQAAPPRLHFRVPPEPSHLLRARERLRDYLRQYCTEGQVIDDVVLCVEEAATNAIRHSGSPDDIEIALHFGRTKLVATVKDRGRGFDVASFDPDRRPDPLLDHGRGLFIIASLMDSLDLHLDGGLEVQMVRKAEALPALPPLESGLGERVAGSFGHDEARTRALLEEIDEAFVALDWEYRYIYANAHACRLLGRPRDEMLGNKLFALFPKLLGSELERGFRAAMELGRPSAMEWHSPILDAWVETRIYPTAAGVTAYFHDISERKRKEEERDELLDALSTSQAMLARSQELAHLGSWELDLTTGQLAWSDEVYRIFGLAPQEFGATYEAFLERVHPDDRAAVDAAYSGSLRENRDSYEIEHRVVRKDSSEIRYVHERCDHLRDESGKIVRSVGMVHDITERKRAGEALRVGEANLRSLFDNMLDGYAYCRMVYEAGKPSDFVYLEVNPAFEALTGLRDVVGRKVSEVIPDIQRDNPELFELYGRVATSGAPESFETHLPALDIWFSVSAYRPLPGHFVAVFENITLRKRAEGEHDRLIEQLSRSIEREIRAARSAETLAKINEILLTALTPDDVIARLVGEASQAAGAEKALVIRVGEQGSYTITHVRNVRNDLVGKVKDTTFYPGFALAAAKRRPILIADNWSDERLNKDFVVPYGLHAFQLLPLIVDGKVTHVLALSYDEAQAFDDEDYRAAERMAEAMSAALRNALLFAAEQEARRQASQQLEFAQVLLDVSAVAANWTALHPMLEGLADALLRATAHSRVTIGLWDEERKSMTTVVSKGSPPIPLSTLGFSEMSAPARRMVKTKRRVLIDYARAKDERLRRLARKRHLRYGLAVPVLARGHLVASITVDAPGERQAFAEREIALIQAVADQAAVAIENARLTEGLRKSEEGARFLANVVETADVPFAVREPDGRLVLFNRAFVELVGYSRRELDEGASTLAVGLTPPDWWEVEEPLLAEAVATRRPVRYEKEYLRKDGSRVPVEVFAQPVFDNAGELLQYHSFITDISERKRAEEALRESEEQYRTMVETAAEGVVVAGPDGTYTYVNQRMADMLGYAPEEILGKSIHDLTSDDGLRAQILGARDELRQGDAVHGEIEFRRKDGSSLWAMYSISPLRDAHGAHIGNLAMHTDITERKQVDEALREGRADLEEAAAQRQLALDAARLGWWRYDPQTNVSWYDEGYRTIFDVTGSERPNDEILERLHPDDLPGVRAKVEAALDPADPKPYVAEYRIHRSDGSLRWVEAHGIAAFEGEGDQRRATSLVGTAQDITERKQAEEERQRLLEESQAQTEELQAQSEELQTQGEELQVQAEELHVQTEELRSRSDDLAERARLAEALNAVNRLVHSTLEFDEIMQRALNRGVEALAVDAGTIEMRDRSQWVVRYQHGFTETDIGRRLTEVEAPNATRAFVSMKPFAIADMRLDPVVNVGFVRDHALRSLLAVPLIARDAVIGCLLFYGRQARTFDEAEMDFAGKLGATVSLALENARQRDKLGRIAALRYARSLIEASLDPLVTISAEGKITDVNAATEQATGLTREELIGTRFSDYFTEPERARAGYREVFASGSVRDYPLALRHASGKITEVLYNASLYRNEAGEVLGIFAAARDVSERNRAQTAALEYARLYESQREIALTLQENFVHPLPAIAGLELAELSLPAGRGDLVGGDFRDVIVRPDGVVVALIGDVTGKGIRAAGFTETVRSAVRTLALISAAPEYILGNVNRLILAEGAHQQLATALLVAIDPASGRGLLASAGHPPAVHITDAGCRFSEPRFGLPLGAFEQGYQSSDFTLVPGEALVLYTDGLTEARHNGELFGEKRLLQVLGNASDRDPSGLVEALKKAVLDHAGELRDDLQILAIRRR